MERNECRPEKGCSRQHRRWWRTPGRALLSALLLVPALGARAQTFTSLFSLDSGVYGAIPQDALLLHDGVLYGTASQRGAGLSGTVFSVDPASGAASLVYAFAGPLTGGGDAAWPLAGLIYQGGYFYGVTEYGGTAGWGAVFRIDATTGAETVLYSFTNPLVNGYNPAGALLYHDGSLYGTTPYGGRSGDGIIYKVDVATGAETILYRFSGPDGAEPNSSLTYVNGVLYGTTTIGGATSGPYGGYGTVFSYNLATGKERVLHRFGTYGDGAAPMAGLTYQNGKLYGTTINGGMGGESTRFPGPGIVFQIDPKTGAETILHAFNATGDGTQPAAGLIERNGMLYGTTQNGGAFGWGTVFSLDPVTRRETLLYSFTGGADGSEPLGGLVYAGGSFYGTTSSGGSNGSGSVFRITP